MRRRALLILPILAILAAACGTAAPAITDPKEILTKSVESLKDVKTIQLRIDVSGKIKADLTGTGGGQLDLKGTEATLDVDVPGKKLKASGSMPALLNSGGELILLEDALYYKLSGVFAQSDKYTKQALPSTAPTASSVTDPATAIAEMRKALDKLPAPTLGAKEKCGDADCYHVSLTMTAADIAKLSPGSASDLPATGAFKLDLYSRTNDLRPARIVLTIDAADQGSLTVTIEATYDGSVTINAPPADQVTEGGGLPFPSFLP